jgi:hypothetical protein
MKNNIATYNIMLGHKGLPSGKFGQKGSPKHSLIGGLHKSSSIHSPEKVKEMIAKASNYGSLEKK